MKCGLGVHIFLSSHSLVSLIHSHTVLQRCIKKIILLWLSLNFTSVNLFSIILSICFEPNPCISRDPDNFQVANPTVAPSHVKNQNDIFYICLLRGTVPRRFRRSTPPHARRLRKRERERDLRLSSAKIARSTPTRAQAERAGKL